MHLAKQQNAGDTTQLAISYSRPTLTAGLRQVEGREAAAGATYVNSIDFPGQNISTRVVSVPTSKVATVTAQLRAQAGVTAVGTTGERRFSSTSVGPHWTNDTYFTGQGAVKQVLPYAESSTITGQWDMHAIGLERAFGYADNGGTVAANPLALGSSTIKIAVIDTGVDSTHPELSSKVAYQRCFVTNNSGVRNTGNFANDPQGHGTDVAGIAGAATNNGLGFAGTGGNAVIYAYRVFPTPNDSCENASSTSDQCSSDTGDIAAAINDAVQQGVSIISMSLGGGSCTAGGVDNDSVENAAVMNALSHNIIVVAAAGNAGGNSVDAPGCITGVIAVGASALNDGVATGTTSYTRAVIGASPTNILEYVPSYSQAGTVNTFGSVSSWGIVAPGGDPSNADVTASNNTTDYLHWIENLWTSLPFDANFAGACSPDYGSVNAYPGISATTDCRTLIAGTSMSTPHVAGAAALILAVNPSYASPAAMKLLLCQTADNLGDTRQGCGRLNVYRAMAKALNDPTLP